MTDSIEASIQPLDPEALAGAEPGPDWSLSPEAMSQIREIDDNIRRAHVEARSLQVGNRFARLLMAGRAE